MSHRRLAFALGLLGAVALAGCGALDPYPTAPAAAVPKDTGPPRVAICYNTLHTTLDQVREAAQPECGPGTTAEPAETDWHLQNCPLLLPARATFVCAAKK
jgi:hypothetical protein